MDRNKLVPIILTIVIAATLIIGEVNTYNPASADFSSSVSSDGSWSVSTSASEVYDAVLLDNGTFEVPEKFLIYYDESYGSKVNDPLIEIGARALDQEYYMSQLINNLEYLGIKDVKKVDAGQLYECLSDPGQAYGRYGLVMISGAIPETVYDGSSSSLIIKWISEGGSLYWAGAPIGKYIGLAGGGIRTINTGYSTLFLGAECLNPAEQDSTRRAGAALDEFTGNILCNALSLKNNNILYGVDASKLQAGTAFLCAGYCQDGYASIAFVEHGDGQVCIMAGDYSNHQRMDLATVLAAGLCCSTAVKEWKSGSVSHGTVNGRFGVSITDGSTVFIMLGGDFSVYGQRYSFPTV